MSENLIKDYQKIVLEKYPEAECYTFPENHPVIGQENHSESVKSKKLFSVYSKNKDKFPFKAKRLSYTPFEGVTASSPIEAWKQAAEKISKQNKKQKGRKM